MSRSRMAVLVVVLLGVVGSFLLPSVGEIQADPTKTKPCGTSECLVNERCCFVDPCSDAGTCIPSFAKCPPPLPCEPPASMPPGTTTGIACDQSVGP